MVSHGLPVTIRLGLQPLAFASTVSDNRKPFDPRSFFKVCPLYRSKPTLQQENFAHKNISDFCL